MSWLTRERGAPAAWPGDLPVQNRYTAGIAGERFLRALKDEGRILGTPCPHCDRTYVPGRLYCERCMARLEQWVEVGNRGELHSFTLLYEDLEGRARAEPEVVAFVRLADGGLVHRLGEVDLEQIEIGMPVEAVFRPPREREGSILDIRYFRPVRG